jgi:hypothetical protein
VAVWACDAWRCADLDRSLDKHCARSHEIQTSSSALIQALSAGHGLRDGDIAAKLEFNEWRRRCAGSIGRSEPR